MSFWQVIREVSAQTVREEAARLYVLALAGDPEIVAAARARVLGAGVTTAQEAAAEPYLFTASPPYSDADEKKLRHADLLVSLPGGPGITEFRPADTIRVERLEDLLPRILEHRPDLRVGLARRLPGFREPAAEHVVREVSRVNAEFAALSTLTASIPFLLPLFPFVSGADVVILTKNQVIMMYRLAAIYGEGLDLKTRLREAIPIIGGALGWRTIARTVAGALPGALGLPIKAAIAYTGTYATGRAAQIVFDEGRRPTRQEMLKIYEEGQRLAKDTVARLKERVERKQGEGKADEEPAVPPALPAATNGLPAESPPEPPEAPAPPEAIVGPDATPKAEAASVKIAPAAEPAVEAPAEPDELPALEAADESTERREETEEPL